MTSELETAFESYIRFLAPDLAAGMVAQHPVGPLDLQVGKCYNGANLERNGRALLPTAPAASQRGVSTMTASNCITDVIAPKPRHSNVYQKIDCTCPNCGKRFRLSPVYVKRNNTNYCSVKCRAETRGREQAARRPKYVCEECGGEFSRPPCKSVKPNRFCSKECQLRSNRKLVAAVCPTCGAPFRKTNSKSIYCSISCRNMKGSNNPSWGGGPVEHICLTCETKFQVSRGTHNAGQGKYCSRKCYAAGKAKTMQGADYTRARGGKRSDLGDRYFRSAWEANYARYLNWLVGQRVIAAWEYEPQTFVFHGVSRGVLSYTPDFKVTDFDGSYEWHEIKGWMDDKSKAKLKRMAKFYPNEIVIVIGHDEYRAISKWAPLIGGWERTSGHSY